MREIVVKTAQLDEIKVFFFFFYMFRRFGCKDERWRKAGWTDRDFGSVVVETM